MQFLPELWVWKGKQRVSEAWHGRKWLWEVPGEIATPMVRSNDIQFFVGEVVGCSDGSLFIPSRFYQHKTDEQAPFLCSLGYAATLQQNVSM